MSWSTQIFAYCERGSNPAFWAEPLNALTNAAFFIAAALALITWLGQPREQRGAVEFILIGLVFAIGTGSFLFHTLATRWAAVADWGPISIFMVAYVVYAMRRFIGLPIVAAVAAGAGFVVVLVLVKQILCQGAPCFNGSVGYSPALAVLIGIGAERTARGHPAGRLLLAAGLVFLLSLVTRTIDRAICPWTLFAAGHAAGTHFIWHVLNAVVLYILLHA